MIIMIKKPIITHLHMKYKCIAECLLTATLLSPIGCDLHCDKKPERSNYTAPHASSQQEAQRKTSQQSAKPNVPAGLEKFLLDDPDLKLVKFWDPKEIGDAFQVNVEDNYIARYEYAKGGLVLEECSFFGKFDKMAAAHIDLRELSKKDMLVKLDGLYCPVQIINTEDRNYQAVLYFRFDDKRCNEIKESINKTGDKERIKSFNLLMDDFVKKVSTTLDSFKKKGEITGIIERSVPKFDSYKIKTE